MADNGIGDYFISDAEDEFLDDDEPIAVPVVVPVVTTAAPAVVQPPTPTIPAQLPRQEATFPPVPQVERDTTPPPAATVRPPTREEQLAGTLDYLMENSTDVQAAALVSMDGFTMASALPDGMQEDRVGAMSAAILGLGERAATELGRGQLTQVFIEGDDGYVVLIAAGDRAVLTALAHADSKLGLVLYDMKACAETIADILR